MQVLQMQLMKIIVSIMAPSSPAFGNATQSFFTKEQNTNTDVINIELQPADIIFTRTDSLIYNSSRSFIGINYDHVAVVINNEELLHISPPIVSRLPIKYLLTKSRSPIVIRPSLLQSEKQIFLSQLLNLLGTKYSMSSIPIMFLNQILTRLKMPQKYDWNIQKLKESRICSDAILYALCVASQKFKKQFQLSVNKKNFQKIGFVLPDDFLNGLKSLYPVVYQEAENSFTKPMLQSAQQKINKIIEAIKPKQGKFLLTAKLYTLLKSNLSIRSQTKIFKGLLFNNIKMITLATIICDILGYSINSEDYTRKIMLLTSLMTIVGSGLWALNKNTITQYEIPDVTKVEKLNLKDIKPKL